MSKAEGLSAPTPQKLQASRTAQLYANRCQAHLNLEDVDAALADAEAAVAAAPGGNTRRLVGCSSDSRQHAGAGPPGRR